MYGDDLFAEISIGGIPQLIGRSRSFVERLPPEARDEHPQDQARWFSFFASLGTPDANLALQCS